MTLELHATPEEVMRAVEALQEFGAARQVAGKILFGLTLALEECGSNIVNHALQPRPRRNVPRDLRPHRQRRSPSNCAIAGPAFDPTLRPAGRAAKPTTTLRPAAGEFFSSAATRMKYTTPREGGENVLRLTKHLDADARMICHRHRNTDH